MANSIIGYHYATGGKKDGIGDWIKNANQNSIPVFLKGADDYGVIFEAIQTGKQYGIENWLGFRFTRASGKVSREVPNYLIAPWIDAPVLCAEVVGKLPPELDKSRVWLEIINEPRDENTVDDEMYNDMNATDYLGWWCLAAAQYLNGLGYKFMGPSFNSGRPGREGYPLSDTVIQYSQPGMLAYLEYCSENPDKAALSVHEYMWSAGTGGTPDDWYPSLIGRFEAAIAACDLAGISRNFNIFVTEWGFGHNNAPRIPEVEPLLDYYNQLAARWPQIKGAATWTLQSDWGDVDEDVNTYMQYDIKKSFSVGEQPAKTHNTFGETLPVTDCKGLPRENYTRRYNVIPSDATEQQAVDIFLEGWRRTRETTGGSYDDAGIGDLPVKIANLYGVADSQKQVFINWYAQHYPGTIVKFLPIPGDNPDNPFGLGR